MISDNNLIHIVPNWPAPYQVHALTTTRQGGISTGPYTSFNLASHIGDDPMAVNHNRQLLRASLALPAEPYWLEQVHGIHVCNPSTVRSCQADASYACQTGIVCTVLTADCLPVLFCDRPGTQVAAAHAGWRGLLAGILEKTVSMLATDPNLLLAWLGPAIGPSAFEVGCEVYSAFVAADAAAIVAFQPSASPQRWLADLYQLARLRLKKIGVHAIYGGDRYTFSTPQYFYSYRRDGLCGRMASLIWLDNGNLSE